MENRTDTLNPISYYYNADLDKPTVTLDLNNLKWVQSYTRASVWAPDNASILQPIYSGEGEPFSTVDNILTKRIKVPYDLTHVKTEITGFKDPNGNQYSFAPNTATPSGPFILNNTGNTISASVPRSAILIVLRFDSVNSRLQIVYAYNNTASTFSYNYVFDRNYYCVLTNQTSNNTRLTLTKEQTNGSLTNITNVEVLQIDDNWLQDSTEVWEFLSYNAFHFPLFPYQ